MQKQRDDRGLVETVRYCRIRNLHSHLVPLGWGSLRILCESLLETRWVSREILLDGVGTICSYMKLEAGQQTESIGGWVRACPTFTLLPGRSVVLSPMHCCSPCSLLCQQRSTRLERFLDYVFLRGDEIRVCSHAWFGLSFLHSEWNSCLFRSDMVVMKSVKEIHDFYASFHFSAATAGLSWYE